LGLQTKKHSTLPHPLLGWTKRFDPETYKHEETDKIKSRTAVLLFGDSFAECTAPTPCFEDILNASPKFNKNFYLLNYGVQGYGLDQIVLLAEKVIPLYPKAKVIFSFMTLDLDRVALTVRPRQKPYFRVIDGRLHLMPPNVEPLHKYHEDHPPGITSYALRFLKMKYLSKAKIEELLELEHQNNEVIQISSLLIDRILATLANNDLDHLVIIFSPHWRNVSELGQDTWRDLFLRNYFSNKSETVLWAKQAIAVHSKHTHRNFRDYIKIADGHPNELHNRIISDLIIQWLDNITKPNKQTA
jgi:hypothetical protein